MMNLPGLNLATPVADAPPIAVVEKHEHNLRIYTEYRFEVSFARTLTIKLLEGTAEYFGTELAPTQTYSFSGTKGAIFTWHGCRLEVSGEAESEYVAEETGMVAYANAHLALEGLRDRGGLEGGPRVLVVGPENAGKTSLCKILTAYAVKVGRQPMMVNLDPRQGMLSVPGSLSTAAFSSILDVEEGWGSSPISGPSPIPVKMPLVYHYGLANPEEGKVFKPLVTRMALAVISRLEEEPLSKSVGFVIDTPGSISAGKGGVYDNIEHIVSEFSINVVFVLGSERLYSDLSRKYQNRPTDEAVNVVRLDKSGGCVDRDEAYMKQFRQAQIRAYFFGSDKENGLAPHSQTSDFGDLNIFRIAEDSSNAYGHDEDDMYSRPSGIYEKTIPTLSIQNSLLAVTTASPADRQEVIRDASVRGYVYVSDVDETKKKVRLLLPQPGQTPANAMILGSFPEDVPGLVS
ncbi:pre-mRNA cleavage complex II protein-like protein Clp1 [Polyplosphaeria fusca]|uniref:Polynucleotide 5'-hydroxyl-kinase GRC3 n=1 Tax=Polyplosphaeria fusca TaxID=682080 RepID=A0A9P4V423_9PLEO|nr:pre-mRNA cleavage complex II protein-like protein Clp1 [Polyplosphaeria fusca]